MNGLLLWETYRLAHKASKDELDKFLNTYKEYKDLTKKPVSYTHLRFFNSL